MVKLFCFRAEFTLESGLQTIPGSLSAREATLDVDDLVRSSMNKVGETVLGLKQLAENLDKGSGTTPVSDVVAEAQSILNYIQQISFADDRRIAEEQLIEVWRAQIF